MMDMLKTSEAELRRLVEEGGLLDQIDPEVPLRSPMQREVKLGALRVDLLAANAQGGLTVVEYKVVRNTDTLSKLLLYPRAVAEVLKAQGCPDVPPLRSVLVSSFIDRGVIDLVKAIKPPYPILLRLCVPDGESVKLIDPTQEAFPERQCVDQAFEYESQVHWDGGLVVKGERWDLRR